jgi:hypothetical protein
MTREDLIPVYLSGLEKAKYELDKAVKSSCLPADRIEQLRWQLEVEVRRVQVNVYDGLIKLLQE